MEAIEFYYKGIEYFNNKEYLSAIKYFEISNSLESHYKTYEMLFQCWKEISNMNKSYDCIKKSYILNPVNDKVTFEYAEISIKLGYRKLAKGLLIDI